MSSAADHPAVKLGAFAMVLALVLGGGVAVGRAVGPLDVDEGDDTAPGHRGHDTGTQMPATADHADHTSPGDHPAGGQQRVAGDARRETSLETAAAPNGVLVVQDGYRLEAERTVLDGIPGAPFRFRIVGSGGRAVRDFTAEQGQVMHLMVVSQDLNRFAHLHPTGAADGTWTAYLPQLPAGAYRAFADFAVAGGPALTLGIDLTVPGHGFFPPALPPPAATAVVDGYEVTLRGTPAAGSVSRVELRVRRGGAPVTHLDPYLGGEGHLAAIRAGDLAYLQVERLGSTSDGGEPATLFAVDVPSPGDYRLFYEFAHGGRVHTAAFTVRVPAGGHAAVQPGASAGAADDRAEGAETETAETTGSEEER